MSRSVKKPPFISYKLLNKINFANSKNLCVLIMFLKF